MKRLKDLALLTYQLSQLINLPLYYNADKYKSFTWNWMDSLGFCTKMFKGWRLQCTKLDLAKLIASSKRERKTE